MGSRRHNLVGRHLDRIADVFSTLPTDFGTCSLMPFEISVPPDSPPVTYCPYRVNPLVANQMHTSLDVNIAAGLIQHSTLPYASPVVIMPKKSGGIRLTISCKKLNSISILGQFPIPRVDEIPDELGRGWMFSLLNLVSSFHHITFTKIRSISWHSARRHGRNNSIHHLACAARGEIRFSAVHGDYRKDAPRGTFGPAGFGLP